ncbi:MAG: hypothetical protein ACK5JL_00140 [Candidatus Kapaibacterium sp.]|jgi:hypothetical protein
MTLLSIPISHRLRSVGSRLAMLGGIALCSVLFVISIGSVQASATQASLSGSEGTAFTFCVLPTFQKSDDSVVLVVRSSHLATITVKATSFAGADISRTIRITDTRRAAAVAFPRSEVELRGLFTDSIVSGNDQAERATRTQVFTVNADSAFSAAVLGGGASSSYAMNLIPDAACGRSYVVATSPATTVLDPNSPGNIDGSKSGPSQFAVIALQNATQVSITLAAKTSAQTSGVITRTLQAGEVFFVQSQLISDVRAGDLSGTIVAADKPVAFFSGNRNANLPPSGSAVSSATTSGCIAQQTPPLERWKNSHIVTPLSSNESGVQTHKEFVRIYGAVAGTVVWVGNQNIGTVKAGEFIERPVDQAVGIRASEPVMITQYVASAAVNGDSLGNSALFTVPPVDQWKRSVVVNALQVRDGAVKRYTTQYLTVITHSSAFKSLAIDGQPTELTPKSISGTPYVYLVRKIADGMHTIECDSICGVIVNGVGVRQRIVTTADLSLPLQPYLVPYLRISDVSVKTGGRAEIFVKMDSVKMPPALMNAKPATFEFYLCFNATVLTPEQELLRVPITNGEQCIPVVYTLQDPLAQGTIYSLPVLCGLGDAVRSKITLRDAVWLTSQGDTIPWLDNSAKGWAVVTDVWSDSSGLRLLNPQTGSLKIRLGPNPVRTTCFVECSTTDIANLDSRLVIFNSVGEIIFEYAEPLGGPANSKWETQIDMSAWPTGVYYARLDRGGQSVKTRFVVNTN